MPLNEELYCHQQICIPPSFPYLLKQYAKAAIRSQPTDLLKWSTAYFRCLSLNIPPPVKPRLEYPIPRDYLGITPGWLRALNYQLQNCKTVNVKILWDRWTGACLRHDTLLQILCLGGFTDPNEIPWNRFIGLCVAFLNDNLTKTMIGFCEVTTEEPEGGSAMVPVEAFLDVYGFLAAIDASAPAVVPNRYFTDVAFGLVRKPPRKLRKRRIKEPSASEESSGPPEEVGFEEEEEILLKEESSIISCPDITADDELKERDATKAPDESDEPTTTAPSQESEPEAGPYAGGAEEPEDEFYGEDGQGPDAAAPAAYDRPLEGAPTSAVAVGEPEPDVQGGEEDLGEPREPETASNRPPDPDTTSERKGEEAAEEEVASGLASEEGGEAEGSEDEASGVGSEHASRAARIATTEPARRERDAVAEAGRREAEAERRALGDVRGIEEGLVAAEKGQVAESKRKEVKGKGKGDKDGKEGREKGTEDEEDGGGDEEDSGMDDYVEEEELITIEDVDIPAVPGIGPKVPEAMVEAVERYLKRVSGPEHGMTMPRHIRHYTCPPLEVLVDDDGAEAE